MNLGGKMEIRELFSSCPSYDRADTGWYGKRLAYQKLEYAHMWTFFIDCKPGRAGSLRGQH